MNTVLISKTTGLVHDFFEGQAVFRSLNPDLICATTDADTAESVDVQTILAAYERERILADLADLDALAVRPLRAVATGTDTQIDRDRLASIEVAAAQLRERLSELG